jgi:hypothetical protein
MYCENCGNEINPDKKFCRFCGNKIDTDTSSAGSAAHSAQASPVYMAEAGPAGKIGYSDRVNDPSFSKYIKNTNRWSGIFAILLAVAAVIGFYIAGETSTEMDNPESLYIGFGIGGMFLLIALFQIIGRKRGKDWDGVVVDKRKLKKSCRQSSGDNDYWVDYMEYVVVIRGDNRKKYKISVRDDDTVFNYYQIGDKVRHHGQLNSYEKYDKSRDVIIFCNACGSLNNIEDDDCFRCKCPLLK